MAHNFRFYEKKRGHRRTGSRTVGSAGEALFFALFLALGCIWLVKGFVSFVVPEWRVNHEFVEHPCTVLEKRIGQSSDRDDGLRYRPEIRIQYELNGETYCTWTYDIHQAYASGRENSEAVTDRFTEHQQCTCWYDPANPRVVVLQRGYSGWNWLTFIVPMSFVVIGGGGLLYAVLQWGKSAECRAAMMRPAQRELRAGHSPDPSLFPHVPDCSDITSSPGTRLAYRLPITSSPAWALFGLLVACLLWNGVVSWCVVLAIRGHLEHRPDWLFTLFVVPFLLLGVALVALFVRQLLVTTGIGPTLVEISSHPLLPSGQYQVFVSQSGRFKIHCFTLSLVCDEEATYRQGTNTRTETRRVYRQELLRQEKVEVGRGAPLEAECSLTMPAEVMHSLKAEHNGIHWKLVVQADVAGWPNFERSFSVIVHPAPARSIP